MTIKQQPGAPINDGGTVALLVTVIIGVRSFSDYFSHGGSLSIHKIDYDTLAFCMIKNLEVRYFSDCCSIGAGWKFVQFRLRLSKHKRKCDSQRASRLFSNASS